MSKLVATVSVLLTVGFSHRQTPTVSDALTAATS
jgi:hypothetical protein